MTTNAQVGARFEREAAAALGSKRTARIGSLKAEQDIAPIEIGGWVLQPEAKVRKTLPKLLTDALQQARRYNPGASPIAVLREKGGRALVACELALFVALVGIDPHALPTKHRATKRSARQLALLEVG